MWIVFGNKMKTERVPNGQRVERHCDACGETAMFYERVASTKLSLYFIELLEYGKRRVMACGACGELYATDELGAVEPGTADKAIGAAKDAFGKLSDAAKKGVAELRGAMADETPVQRSASPEPTDDPLADEENAMEAKFQELEKRYRVK